MLYQKVSAANSTNVNHVPLKVMGEVSLLDKLKRTSLFNFDVVHSTKATVSETIIQCAQIHEPITVNFVNAHCINVAANDKLYRESLDGSSALLPDGSGMAIASKFANVSFGENLNGTDLFPLLCEQAASKGLSIYLHGGEPGIARKTAETMQKRFPNLKIVGVTDGYSDHQDTDQLLKKIARSGADLLFVGLGVPMQEKWIAGHRDEIQVPVVLGVGGLFDYYSGKIPRAPKMVRELGMEWGWRLMQEPKRLAKRYIFGNFMFLGRALNNAWHQRGFHKQLFTINKRALDLSLTLLGLVFLGPLFAAVALLILLEDKGPVFYKQTRIGKDGQPFRMWKFRSMAVDAEKRLKQILKQSDRDDVCFKMRDDPRITKIGKFIRRFSIDELPQLINVVLGDMSLVGPRPALPKEVMQKPDKSINRLAGKPGLTCTWQVSGRAEIPFEEQVKMDEDYLNQPSFFRDVSLLFLTVPAVISGRGAY